MGPDNEGNKYFEGLYWDPFILVIYEITRIESGDAFLRLFTIL